MARYLVTGGCGFIGSHLVHQLHNEGSEVIVLDDLSNGSLDNIPPEITFIKGDVADYQTVEGCFEEIDGCFHLAAIASVERSTEEWTHTHQVNAAATINVFQAASRIKRHTPVIYASSAAVYGNCKDKQFSEDSTLQPLSPYGIDKLTCEMHAHVADLIHHVPTTGFRFFNVYGPRQNPNSPYSGVISIFLDKILKHDDIVIYGDGEQTRDFIFVSDVVNALCSGMGKLEKAPSGHDIFNVCTGSAISVNNLVQTIEDITGCNVGHLHLPARHGDARCSIGNPKKLEKFLHVKSVIPLRDGLTRVIEYFSGNKPEGLRSA